MRKILWLCLFIASSVASAQSPQTQTAPIYPVNAKYTNGVAPGYAPTAGSGLVLNVGSGTVNCSGSINTYAGGTLAMTASATNYVYLNTAASCVPAVKTTAFTISDIPVAVVIAGSATITSIGDDRTFFNFGLEAGGAITGSGTAGYIPIWTTSTNLGDSLIDYGVTNPDVITINSATNINGPVTVTVGSTPNQLQIIGNEENGPLKVTNNYLFSSFLAFFYAPDMETSNTTAIEVGANSSEYGAAQFGFKYLGNENIGNQGQLSTFGGPVAAAFDGNGYFYLPQLAPGAETISPICVSGTSGQIVTSDCSGESGGVSSLNSLTGALSITAGTGISVTPSGSNIAIAVTGSGSGCSGSTANGVCYNNSGTGTYSTDVTIDASSVPVTVNQSTVAINSYAQEWAYGPQPVSGSTAKSASMSFGDDNGANDAGGLYLFGNSIDNLVTVTNFTTTGGQIASFVDPNLASSTSTWLTIDFGGDTLTDFQGMLGFWDRGGSGSTTNMVGLGVGTSNDVNSTGLLIDGAKNVYLPGLTGYPSFSPTPSHPWQMISPSGSSGAVQLESAYTTVQNAGSGVVQEPFLNFITGATCVDDPSHTSTDCTINAAGLTLTTTGSSGAATLSGSTLNIPIYAASGGYPAAVTLTASSSSELDFTTCITGSYSNYQITFTNLVPSTAANVMIQMSSNGGTSYDTGSNYWSSNQYWGVNTSDSGSIATNVNLTGFSLWGSSADNIGPYSGTFTMIAPGQSSEPVQFVGRSIGKNSAGNYYTQSWGDIYNPGTLVVNNAFRVILSTGTIASGKVTCQPIPN